jgi:hypothetical protein
LRRRGAPRVGSGRLFCLPPPLGTVALPLPQPTANTTPTLTGVARRRRSSSKAEAHRAIAPSDPHAFFPLFGRVSWVASNGLDGCVRVRCAACSAWRWSGRLAARGSLAEALTGCQARRLLLVLSVPRPGFSRRPGEADSRPPPAEKRSGYALLTPVVAVEHAGVPSAHDGSFVSPGGSQGGWLRTLPPPPVTVRSEVLETCTSACGCGCGLSDQAILRCARA